MWEIPTAGVSLILRSLAPKSVPWALTPENNLPKQPLGLPDHKRRGSPGKVHRPTPSTSGQWKRWKGCLARAVRAGPGDCVWQLGHWSGILPSPASVLCYEPLLTKTLQHVCASSQENPRSLRGQTPGLPEETATELIWMSYGVYWDGRVCGAPPPPPPGKGPRKDPGSERTLPMGNRPSLGGSIACADCQRDEAPVRTSVPTEPRQTEELATGQAERNICKREQRFWGWSRDGQGMMDSSPDSTTCVRKKVSSFKGDFNTPDSRGRSLRACVCMHVFL